MTANCWLTREACGSATAAFPIVSRRQSGGFAAVVPPSGQVVAVFTVIVAVPVARQVSRTLSVPADGTAHGTVALNVDVSRLWRHGVTVT